MILHLGILISLFYESTRGQEGVVLVQVEFRQESSEKIQTQKKTESSSKDSVKATQTTSQSEDNAQARGDSLTVNGTEAGISVNYPRLSRTLGEEGLVTVSLIATEGRPLAVISKSSGYERLDTSALTAVQGAIAQGKVPVQYLKDGVQLNFMFRLKSSSAANAQ